MLAFERLERPSSCQGLGGNLGLYLAKAVLHETLHQCPSQEARQADRLQIISSDECYHFVVWTRTSIEKSTLEIAGLLLSKK